MNKNINIQTWNQVYSEGRSLLKWPDESIVSFLSRNKKNLSKGIDIACGAGRHAFLMAEMGIDSIGLDSSDASIKYAIDRAQQLGLDNIKFYKGLAQEIDITEETYDIVIVWGLFHYLTREDQQILLKKVNKILNTDGYLLCTLRSIEDTRAKTGEKIGENSYLVNYFDEETNIPKQTLMDFWDEAVAKEFFSEFKEISLGHRILEPIGGLGKKTAHWLVAATK